MRVLIVVVAALLGSCAEPSKRGQYEQIVSSLRFMHIWDPQKEGAGHFAYDAAMSSDEGIDHVLAARITDEEPTAIHDRIAERTAKVGDVAFFILLRRTNMKWQDFSDYGVFVSSQLPNPIFCIKWDPGARMKVRNKFLELLP
ncbi:MAG TPA: hypothetical protein VEJ18_22470, partial [Planctomycetota bacterium]|nr:hypothetical protein [Planctomycetota bacterium]